MTVRSAIAFLLAVCLPAILGSIAAEDAGPNSEKFAPAALGMEVPIITSSIDRDKYVGRLVAIRGVVDNTKDAAIAGVSIDAPDELRGKEAYAVGILGKFTVPEDDNRKSATLAGPIANSEPGVKYTLYFDLEGKRARARPVPK